MRILIGKPTRHIELFRSASEQGMMYNDDVEKLYDMLPDIITKMGHEAVILNMSKDIRRIYQEKNSKFLAWHNHGTTPNTWFIKQAYIPDYFYFDKTGYSGWSELTESYDYDIDINSIRDEVTEFTSNYIANNISRFNQTHEEPIPKTPYVLFLGQRSDDVVSDFAYIDNLEAKLVKLFENTKYIVHVKPHPLELEWCRKTKQWKWTVNELTGSLHELIANSSAVYTINSSAGFESLLHGKRVFTAGQCDYHWATDVIKTEEDLERSIDLIEQPVNIDRITKFLHYCLNYHFMNVNDESSIVRKILRATNEKT